MNHESISGREEQPDTDRLHQLQDNLVSDPDSQPYPDGEYCGNDPELFRENNEFYQARDERIEQLRAEIQNLQAKIAKN